MIPIVLDVSSGKVDVQTVKGIYHNEKTGHCGLCTTTDVEPNDGGNIYTYYPTDPREEIEKAMMKDNMWNKMMEVLVSTAKPDGQLTKMKELRKMCDSGDKTYCSMSQQCKGKNKCVDPNGDYVLTKGEHCENHMTGCDCREVIIDRQCDKSADIRSAEEKYTKLKEDWTNEGDADKKNAKMEAMHKQDEKIYNMYQDC